MSVTLKIGISFQDANSDLKSKNWAITVGVLGNIIASTIVTTIVAIFWTYEMAQQGVKDEHLTVFYLHSISFLSISLAINLIFTAAGAYIAVTIAACREYYIAAWVGIFSLLFEAVLLGFYRITFPYWYLILGASLMIPFALIGARIRIRFIS